MGRTSRLKLIRPTEGVSEAKAEAEKTIELRKAEDFIQSVVKFHYVRQMESLAV
jgi:hypothetical protein